MSVLFKYQGWHQGFQRMGAQFKRFLDETFWRLSYQFPISNGCQGSGHPLHPQCPCSIFSQKKSYQVRWWYPNSNHIAHCIERRMGSKKINYVQLSTKFFCSLFELFENFVYSFEWSLLTTQFCRLVSNIRFFLNAFYF